ncbi:MAG: formate--tetrahydrofolate ligase [Myxococcota bacterium]
MLSIPEVAAQLGVPQDLLIPYGRTLAKIDLDILQRPRTREAPPRLVLVSAMTPTKAGEGKTTTTIGLGNALARLGKSVCLALREPSLGPCMGVKGGGTGGGRSQLVPSDRINLHCTGDFHAVTSAHNLLAAAIDNHLHFETDLNLESRRVLWPRVIDMNDRALRETIVGLGGKPNGQPRQAGFDITAASELMAMLCLASDYDDLRARIERTLIGFTKDKRPVSAKETGVVGAMMALLADALHPNLAQTQEGTPALVHGGPFANIAHGCNSIVATRTAMHLADWTVTEAGFGFDLGAEKFFNIKLRQAGLNVVTVVLVASVRALKMHGGRPFAELTQPDPEAVERGLPNLGKHIDSANGFGFQPIIALNRFGSDTDEEIGVVKAYCEKHGLRHAVCTHFANGGEGALDLAQAVVDGSPEVAPSLKPTYPLDAPVKEKIRAVATQIYGAQGVVFSPSAEKDLATIQQQNFENLPVCMAKTQASLSDDPKRPGRPEGFDITVRNIQVNAGAGFLVVLTGDMLRMPGLPRVPAADRIDLVDGQIQNLF